MRRRLSTATALLLLLLASALAPGPASGQEGAGAATSAQVRGRVSDAAANEPVAGTLVWLAGRTIHLAHTGPDGSYEFTRLAPGSYCLRVESPGYEAARVCITVSAGASLGVDLPLTPRPVTMEPLLVQGQRRASGVSARDPAGDSALVTPLERQLAVLGARSVNRGGTQLGDLAQMPHSDRGGGRRPHALYLWGSSADRGRVLLDGASLSAPLHLGSLLPPVDPHVVESADLQPAGVSPRYDGGTAYIMNITTRRAADRQRTWGELDLLAGRVGAETPVHGRGRLLVSARRVNSEIIEELASPRFGYGYADALLRAELDAGAGTVQLTAFTTGESVTIPRDLAEDRAAWQNRAATLAWQPLDERATVAISMSRGVADLPLLSALGGHLEATLDRYGVLAERNWTARSTHWNAGIELERHTFHRTASATHDPVSGEPGTVSCTTDLPCRRAVANIASAFGGALFSPARAVSVSAGARMMYDDVGSSIHVLPRVSITAVPDARHSITLSAGRFSQPFVRDDSPGADQDGVAHADVGIAHAVQLELGALRRTERMRLRGSVFLRQHERIDPTDRSLTVPGADVSLEHSIGRTSALMLAYGIAGAHRDGPDRPQHLLSAGVYARQGRFLTSTSITYASGVPITTIVLDHVREAEFTPTLAGGNPQSRSPDGRVPDYFRIDAMVGAEWHIGRDRNSSITPYLRIVDALGQRESLFYFQDGEDLTRPPRALARIPAIPVLGLRWSFQ